MGKKPIIKLRTYRGLEKNYDANGNIKNENNLVSLEHNSKEWVIFMKNLRLNGFCAVEVEKGFKQLESGYEPITDLSAFQKEVDEAFNPKQEVTLTPDQKRIAELEAKLEAFMNGGKQEVKGAKKVAEKPLKEVVEQSEKPAPNINDREALVAEYEKVFGKKPFNGWNNQKLAEMIAESTK